MDKLEKRKFQLHAETGDFQDRIRQARDWIHRIFDRFQQPNLNYSGGKDSLVMLHLVTDCGYRPDVYHFDNGVLRVPGNVDFVRNSVDRIAPECRLVVRSSAAANSEKMVTEEGHGYNGFWGWYRQLQEDYGWDVRLVGIRAAESNERRDRVEPDGLPVVQEEYVAAFPIHRLTTRDIWAYIVDHDLSYHSIYDKQGDLYGSMEARGNRLVTLYDAEFDSLGAREVSQFVYPGRTNELKAIEQADD